jgi:hypothetical protein
MWLTLDDLQCSECGAFVHPLIDSCPECGVARVSRLGEAAAGPVGAVRLLEAPETQRMAHNITVRYTMKVNAIGGGVADPSLDDAVAHLADALTYRIGGDAVPDTDNAGLTLRDGCLIAQARPSGALLAEIPLPSILAAAAGRGDVTVHYAAPSGSGVGGAPSETPTVATRRRLSVANRRGLLAQRARDGHYEDLSRWLIVLTAAAAERRWIEIGLAAYLAELGLAPELAVPSPAAVGASESAGPATAPAAASSSAIGASLLELESLRAAGLLAEDEYSAKRREILARL